MMLMVMVMRWLNSCTTHLDSRGFGHIPRIPYIRLQEAHHSHPQCLHYLLAMYLLIAALCIFVRAAKVHWICI